MDGLIHLDCRTRADGCRCVVRGVRLAHVCSERNALYACMWAISSSMYLLARQVEALEGAPGARLAATLRRRQVG